MQNGEPDLGEQALSKAAELGINSQLDEAKELDVEIRTDPVKLVQGKLDSVSVAGEGMVMKQDLRMEELTIKTGNVSVEPISAAFGKIQLTQSTDADALITLTEQDINRAIKSRYLGDKMQDISVQTEEGQSAVIHPQHVEIHLPDRNTLHLNATVLLPETNENKQVSIDAKLHIRDNG
jgi:hypothetical protein